MSRSRKSVRPTGPETALVRPVNLITQVEQLLRQAIADRRWPGGRLPTEIELAEQLGVSRETVRLAAGALQRDGLLVKIRRKGTFTAPPRSLPLKLAASRFVGYLQVDYQTLQGQEEVANRAISGLMVQGAIEEASRVGFEAVVAHAPSTSFRAEVVVWIFLNADESRRYVSGAITGTTKFYLAVILCLSKHLWNRPLRRPPPALETLSAGYFSSTSIELGPRCTS